MKNIHRVTYGLPVLIVLTLAFFVAKTRSSDVFIANAQTQTAMQRHLERKRTFPIVEYDEPEPSDYAKRAPAREKQKRRDTLRAVTTTPHPQEVEVSLQGEGGDELAGVPVDKSDLIVSHTTKMRGLSCDVEAVGFSC